jgi:Tfp pilus assembly protein PilW
VLGESGFSMIELMVATGIMIVIVGAGMSAIMRVVNSQQTIWNRTEMHSGVRSATELLQQEVGQAGRVSTLTSVTLAAAVGAGANPVTLASPSGTPTASLFVGEQVIVGSDVNQETVALTAVDTVNNQITALFVNAHPNGSPVTVAGGFAAGVVPDTALNGSSPTVLKLFGDINSDGNMLYIEYTCDTAGGNLYRNAMAWTTLPANKPALDASLILLRNITANPNNAACFTYQEQVANGVTYVTDVAITLTVQTRQVDPLTKRFQKETKALLNVSPRNIFDVWELASMTPPLTDRVQPTPATVTALMQ